MLNRLIVAGTIGVLACTTAVAAPGEAQRSNHVATDDVIPLSSLSRDPMWIVQCFGGQRDLKTHPEENSTGVRGNWRGPEGLDWFTDELRRGYAAGARRFLVNRVMGTDGTTHPAAAGWLTIPPEKRQAMEKRINDLILDEFDEPVEIYYYIGAYMADPRSIRGRTLASDAGTFRLAEGDHWKQDVATRVTLGGLMGVGATGFGIDGSAGDYCNQHYVELAEQLRRPPFNIILMGEAIPRIQDPVTKSWWDGRGNAIFDQDLITRMPWIATSKYLRSRIKDLKFDRETTRIYQWYEGASDFGRHWSDPVTDADLQLLRKEMDRGTIPMVSDPILFAEALRYTRELEGKDGGTHASVPPPFRTGVAVTDEKFRKTMTD